MRHRVLSKRLKRTSGELNSLLRNQARQLFDHGSITTTLQKAKLVKPFAEKLITKAKNPSFANIKKVKQILGNSQITRKLFSEIAPNFKTRPGGYTRILKLGNRTGDNAQMAKLELVKSVSGSGKKANAKN